MSAMRRHSHALVRVLAVLLGCSVLGTGCGLADTGEAAVTNHCSTDADCCSGTSCPGMSCDTTLSMCVSRSTDHLQVAIEVIPASDPSVSAPTTWDFLPPIDVSGPTQKSLQMPVPITVVGRLQWAGHDRVIPAKVTFTRRDGIPGGSRTRVSTSTTASPSAALDGSLKDYAVRLVANEHYDVLVEPMADAIKELPPMRLDDVTVPGGGDLTRLDLTYPADLTELYGVVVTGAARGTTTPVSGLQVQAIDPATERVLSSTAVTGADGGFALGLSSGATGWVFRIGPGADSPITPTFTVDPAYLFPDSTGAVRILVPNVTPVTYRGFVEDAHTGDPIAGAALTLRSDDVVDGATGVVGSFSATTTADADGQFEVQVLPGTYQVVVTPSSSGRLGILDQTVHIVPPAGTWMVQGQVYDLPRRLVLGGKVVAPDGRTMSGATVQALALGSMPSGLPPAARYNRSTNTVTDPTGQFGLSLDVGAYDLMIKPPVDSGFPWIVSRDLVIGASSGTTARDFDFAAPIPVQGELKAADGTPVVGAEVEAFGILDGSDGPSAFQIAHTVTGPDGSYQLLLPPGL